MGFWFIRRFQRAAGATRIVNLGNASATMTWGSGVFVANGASLILGSESDSAMVDFQNPINLAGVLQTIEIDAGQATIDARLSGVLSGTGTSGVMFVGAGEVELTASNSFTGSTILNGGVVRLSNTAALPGGIGTTGGRSKPRLRGRRVGTQRQQFYALTGNGRGKRAVPRLGWF